jgi:hypothetical protein
VFVTNRNTTGYTGCTAFAGRGEQGRFPRGAREHREWTNGSNAFSSLLGNTTPSQVCTDAQGNRVFVVNGNVTGYTGCAPYAATGGTAPVQVCTDTLGNRVLVTTGGSTTGYTGCTGLW